MNNLHSTLIRSFYLLLPKYFIFLQVLLHYLFIKIVINSFSQVIMFLLRFLYFWDIGVGFFCFSKSKRWSFSSNCLGGLWDIFIHEQMMYIIYFLLIRILPIIVVRNRRRSSKIRKLLSLIYFILRININFILQLITIFNISTRSRTKRFLFIKPILKPKSITIKKRWCSKTSSKDLVIIEWLLILVNITRWIIIGLMDISFWFTKFHRPFIF